MGKPSNSNMSTSNTIGKMNGSKTVTFAENHTVMETENEDQINNNEGNKNELWLSSDEIDRIKENVCEFASTCSRKGYSSFLDNAFENPSKNVERCISDCVEHKSRDIDSLRGIERYLSTVHDEERSRKENKSRNALLSCQRIMKSKGWTADEMEEELANISRHFTLCAKDFALRLGRADQAGICSSRQNMERITTIKMESSSYLDEEQKGFNSVPFVTSNGRTVDMEVPPAAEQRNVVEDEVASSNGGQRENQLANYISRDDQRLLSLHESNQRHTRLTGKGRQQLQGLPDGLASKKNMIASL